MPKPKVYAVKKGRKTGIYHSWDECKAQTHRYNGAVYKSFKTLQEAQQFLGSKTNISKKVVHLGQTEANSSDNDDDDDESQSYLHVGMAMIDTSAVVSSLTSSAGKSKVDLKSKANVLNIQMYFDGGSRGNPGLAGAGAIVYVTDSAEHQSSKSIRHFCGHCTNNVAEYSGLIEGLKQILNIINGFCSNTFSLSTAYEQHIDIIIKGDSNLIINQMNGNYAVKNAGLRDKHQECNRIIKSMKDRVKSTSKKLHISISFEHVYRNKNTIADKLANEAMDERRSWITDGTVEEMIEKHV